MPSLKVGSVRPEMIYTGSTNGFKVYAGSQWVWIQDANFDEAGAVVWTGQDTTYGLGLPITQGDITWTGQQVSIVGTYTLVEVASIIWTGQEVRLPVLKVQKGDVVWTGQDVPISGLAFSTGFSLGFRS